MQASARRIQGSLGALLTFTLLLQFALGFKAAHLEGVELKYMGQQLVGQYPIHFHLAGDLDELGGYDPPTYVRDLSIHHTFSRCVTVHGSNGLLVSACWKGILSRNLGGVCWGGGLQGRSCAVLSHLLPVRTWTNY